MSSFVQQKSPQNIQNDSDFLCVNIFVYKKKKNKKHDDKHVIIFFSKDFACGVISGVFLRTICYSCHTQFHNTPVMV